MTIRAQWIISEAGLQHLSCAGLSTGWLKAWVHSAGADEVSIHPLESAGWINETAQWRIFFADEAELVEAALSLGLHVDSDDDGQDPTYQSHHFLLQNPYRVCSCHHIDGQSILFLDQGDIAFQRKHYLRHLNGGKPLQRLAVIANDDARFKLEPGLSGELIGEGEPLPPGVLNIDGKLLEEQVFAALRESELRLRTVESCTAGAIAARIGHLPGASSVLDRGWVTYSNEAKCDEVAVADELIDNFGAVSQQVVVAMAEGGAAEGTVSVAVSGVAGPSGGTPAKPVGTVWIAVAVPGEQTEAMRLSISGSRSEVQWRTVNAALILLLAQVEKSRR